jgi:hypothetical protein
MKKKQLKPFITCLVISLFLENSAQAFCGFYVAKADTKLYNSASKVVIARHEEKNVITMVNDFEGDLNEFAMVVPVPTVIEKEQVHVTENKIIEHLDAFTSPRLVEYFDPNPCQALLYEKTMRAAAMPQAAMDTSNSSAASLGVKIEAEYTVGEYDIVVLSAEGSSGLIKWLNTNGYKIPQGATDILNSYIKQGIKFFVAKVNLKEQEKLGNKYLRPLQVAFESPKFMLPIRLGTVNAKGPQELFIFTLTKNGKVEPVNYRSVNIATDINVPLFLKKEFNEFYKSMFNEQVRKENMKTIFLEYAWDMGWCDPCASEPMTADELRELGVFWVDSFYNTPSNNLRLAPGFIPPSPPVNDVFVTRMHVRYDIKHFPDDIKFNETNDKNNFQGRYVMNHPWQGTENCQAAIEYKKNLKARFEQEAQNLAKLTGWDINSIRAKMKKNGQDIDAKPAKWYEQMWKKNS